MESIPIYQYTFILLLLATSVLSITDNFFFNGFQQASNLSLDGGAGITSNGILQLTNDTQKVVSHAFFSSPFYMLQNRGVLSFSTTFVFVIITIGTAGGHGFTFALSPSKTLPDTGCCHYLGLLNKSNNGNFSNHVFAVEFDTDQALELINDIDDNHVGIDINSLVSNVSKPASYYTNNTNNVTVQLKSGSPIQAWIDYDGVDKIINVTISPVSVARPQKPLISQAIDLSPILKESTYVGFTSSTGKLASYHYILGWSFKINGVARALDVSQLPLPPQAEGNSQGKNAFGLKIGATSSGVTVLLVVSVILVLMYLHQRSKLAETLEDWELDYPHRFPYKVLHKATKGFKDTELLGCGGFGKVYKGFIPESGEVAIKRISSSSKQGVKEFVAEIACLGRLRHRNLVELQGWCKRDQDLILIYAYMPNGSLDAFLFENSKNKLLSWEQRFKIIKDMALGLLYLHEEWEQVVIHRDIKASNVLLDGDMNGKLGDFGLARFYEHGANLHTTRVVGTVGYIAPELSRMGKATASTDVFAYGMLLLEVVCGRRPIEPNVPTREIQLLDWVRQCWMMGRLLEVVDTKLGGSYSREEVELVLKLGLRCSQSNPETRPTMRQVAQYLNGHGILVDDYALVFSEADTWDLATRSFPSSCGVLSASSISGGR